MTAVNAEKISRRLAAILVADISGYGALMGADEEATVLSLKGHQAVLLPMIAAHGGNVIDLAGDGILAEFPSIIGAVEAAMAMQAAMAERNAGVPPQRRLQFRIGINHGDIVHDEARVYGDGINVAARLQGLAEPGGICVSGKVFDEVRDRADAQFADLGEQTLKNIERPVRVYRVIPGRGDVAAGACGPRATRSAVDRRAALRQYERRPGAGFLRRRDHRRPHHGALQTQGLLRHRPQHDVHLQRKAGGRARRRPRARGPLRARGERPQGGRSHPRHRAARSTRRPAAISGATATTAISTTSSPSRTRSRRASSAASARSCSPPSTPGRAASRRRASTPGSARIRALFLASRLSERGSREALTLLDRAIRSDPDYAQALGPEGLGRGVARRPGMGRHG